MALVEPELLSKTIGSIYDAAYNPSSWPTAIEAIRGLFHGSKACICRNDANGMAEYAIAANPDATFVRKYFEEHAHLPNILAEAISTVPIGTVYSDHTLLGADVIRGSRFWNEWMEPQDMYGGLACKLPIPGPSPWLIDLQRGRRQDGFDANDADLLRVIMPHLARAADISHRFQSTHFLTATFSDLPFGVVLVDGHMRIATMNAAAEILLLRPESGLLGRSGHLVATDAGNMAALQNLVAQACQLRDDIVPGVGGDLLIAAKRRGVGANLALSVMPLASPVGELPLLSPHAAILICAISLELPAGFANQMRTFFDLTPKEASLAASLVSGRTLKQAAEEGDIQFSTARSHLESIFRKTGTRQQSQLVALLKSTQLVVRSSASTDVRR